MKKIVLLALVSALVSALVLSFCGCQVDSKEPTDTNKTSVTEKTTATEKTTVTTTVTTTAAKTTVAQAKFSDKDYSADGFFSLCYSCSSKEIKLGEQVEIKVKLRNETGNTFKVGLEDIKAPAMIAIIKDGIIWGYEGNDTPINNTILPNQEIVQTLDNKFTEPGKYIVFVICDFGREILPSEDKVKVNKSVWDENVADSIMSFEKFWITVT